MLIKLIGHFNSWELFILNVFIGHLTSSIWITHNQKEGEWIAHL